MLWAFARSDQEGAAMLSEAQILEHFAGWDMNEGERHYLRFHVLRLACALRAVGGCVGRLPGRGSGLRLLDIGPHFLTELLRRCYPGSVLNTLGHRSPRCYRAEHGGQHLHFDLNDTQYPERCPAFAEHDVVVMCEVLEHLYTAPELVLGFVRRLLTPGGFLVLQTPNAAVLHKRIALLRGSNPYQRIGLSRENPGHFREYTLHELRVFGGQAELDVDRCDLEDYFGARRGWVGLLTRWRKTFRQGITVIYRRPAGPTTQAA
jgi:SAM-dependent methyltransferase